MTGTRTGRCVENTVKNVRDRKNCSKIARCWYILECRTRYPWTRSQKNLKLTRTTFLVNYNCDNSTLLNFFISLIISFTTFLSLNCIKTLTTEINECRVIAEEWCGCRPAELASNCGLKKYTGKLLCLRI